MKAYRDGEMNLDQLSAFAITDDHDRQERVWAELPTFNRRRTAIPRALSEGRYVPTAAVPVFVDAKAYEAAGGVIVRDLFFAVHRGRSQRDSSEALSSVPRRGGYSLIPSLFVLSTVCSHSVLDCLSGSIASAI
jgi:hypothetical protein